MRRSKSCSDLQKEETSWRRHASVFFFPKVFGKTFVFNLEGKLNDFLKNASATVRMIDATSWMVTIIERTVKRKTTWMDMLTNYLRGSREVRYIRTTILLSYSPGKNPRSNWDLVSERNSDATAVYSVDTLEDFVETAADYVNR